MTRYIYSAGLVVVILAGLWVHKLRIDALNAHHALAIVAVKDEAKTACNERVEASDEICRKSKVSQLAECNRAAAMSGRVLRATCGNLAKHGSLGSAASSDTRYRLLGADGQFLVEFSRLCSGDSGQIRQHRVEQ